MLPAARLRRLATTGGENSYAVEFDTDAAEIELMIEAQSTGTSWRSWVWINGQPLTAAPEQPGGLTATANSSYLCKLTFADVRVRRVRVWLHRIRFSGVWALPSTSVTPTATPSVKAALAGDSYVEAGLDGMHAALALATGWEVYNAGQGGTGYVQAGTGSVFGSSTRLGWLEQIQPDVIIVHGTLNDDSAGASAIGAACSAMYAQLAARCPRALVFVVGPEVSSFADSYTA